MGQMDNWLPDSAFVVVVVHGTNDVTRATLPDLAETKRYIERLRQRGVPAASIRLYRTRMVRPPLRAS
jgi:acetyl esterase/lipase